ncbi:uncharacterized protein LOC118601573 [Rousettus aegyptiacus]|uniref:uncharacterized protein LOC118601573 n=1 Tax=Rousettus aegyptiacus TaxID=9407 RepID=UPI00168D4EBF|nr:uncharacterized protein LOC118601573 [Rousettus aegyptiacus]
MTRDSSRGAAFDETAAAAEAFPEKVLFEQRCEGANQGRRERKNVLERENNKYKSLEPGLLGMPKNSDEARAAEANLLELEEGIKVPWSQFSSSVCDTVDVNPSTASDWTNSLCTWLRSCHLRNLQTRQLFWDQTRTARQRRHRVLAYPSWRWPPRGTGGDPEDQRDGTCPTSHSLPASLQGPGLLPKPTCLLANDISERWPTLGVWPGKERPLSGRHQPCVSSEALGQGGPSSI